MGFRAVRQIALLGEARTLPRFGNSIAAFWFLRFVVCWVDAAFCGVRGFVFLLEPLVAVDFCL